MLTGANSGIGRATALALGARGAQLYLAGRSIERTQPVLDELRAAGNQRVHFLPLDLAKLASVRACAEQFLARNQPLHGLINNAGLAGRRGQTADGFEFTFAVNYLGHFLLTELLLERLKQSAPSRIINVASVVHAGVHRLDWAALVRPTTSWTGFPEYRASKLCNVLHARELARRLSSHRVSSCSLHPGGVASNIWRHVPAPARWLMKPFLRSPERGAATTLHCATAPALESGAYYRNCRVAAASPTASDPQLARELYERSLTWVGLPRSSG